MLAISSSSSSSSSSSPTLDHILPWLCLLVLAAAADNNQHTWALPLPVTLPGCPDKCGNISIPYPFGTQEGCFRPGFRVNCNHTYHPPRAFIDSNLTTFGGLDGEGADGLTQIVIEDLHYSPDDMNYGLPKQDGDTQTSVLPIELVGVSVSEGKAWVLGALTYDCNLNDTHHTVRQQEIRLSYRSPFVLSEADDVLMAIGYNVVAEQSFGPLCQSYFNPMLQEPAVNGSCSGQGCCNATLTPGLHRSKVTIQMHVGDTLTAGTCAYAMIVDKSWYNFSLPDLDGDAFLRRNAAGVVPIVVHFTMGRGGCPNASQPMPKDFPCVSGNSVCVDRIVAEKHPAYLCSCLPGYEGNPYIQGGCQDIDECSRPEYLCYGNCKNTPGDYECTCPAGKRGSAKNAPCTDLFSPPAKISVGT